METNNKLREALGKILWCLEWMFNNTDDKSVQSHLGEPIALAKAALAAPQRNCDIFASESEMESAFVDYYNELFALKGTSDEIGYSDLKHNIDGVLHDYIKWLLAPAKTETKGENDAD